MVKGNRQKGGPSKKDKARAKAERLREKLAHVFGLRPNPCELQGEILYDEDVSTFRFLDCPRYDRCLDVACVANWKGMTCRACLILKRFSNGQIRIVRKVVD